MNRSKWWPLLTPPPPRSKVTVWHTGVYLLSGCQQSAGWETKHPHSYFNSPGHKSCHRDTQRFPTGGQGPWRVQDGATVSKIIKGNIISSTRHQNQHGANWVRKGSGSVLWAADIQEQLYSVEVRRRHHWQRYWLWCHWWCCDVTDVTVMSLTMLSAVMSLTTLLELKLFPVSQLQSSSTHHQNQHGANWVRKGSGLVLWAANLQEQLYSVEVRRGCHWRRCDVTDDAVMSLMMLWCHWQRCDVTDDTVMLLTPL